MLLAPVLHLLSEGHEAATTMGHHLALFLVTAEAGIRHWWLFKVQQVLHAWQRDRHSSFTVHADWKEHAGLNTLHGKKWSGHLLQSTSMQMSFIRRTASWASFRCLSCPSLLFALFPIMSFIIRLAPNPRIPWAVNIHCLCFIAPTQKKQHVTKDKKTNLSKSSAIPLQWAKPHPYKPVHCPFPSRLNSSRIRFPSRSK